MVEIIIGTTPTFVYTFSVVDVADITSAIFTIKQAGTIIIEKDLSDATVGENTLSYTLTQEESLLIGNKTARMMHNFLLSDGTRGASDEVTICGKSNHIAEVMT